MRRAVEESALQEVISLRPAKGRPRVSHKVTISSASQSESRKLRGPRAEDLQRLLDDGYKGAKDVLDIKKFTELKLAELPRGFLQT